MKKTLLIILLNFSLLSFAQEKGSIYDSYIDELITSSNERSLINFDANDVEWRKVAVKKITSPNYRDPSFFKTIMVLHMLEYKLGENVYKKCLDTYVNEVLSTNKNMNTRSLKESLELQTNTDLSSFFNDWFAGKGYPSYTVHWFQNKNNGNINISIKQTQSDISVSFFEFPIPIEVRSSHGDSQFIRLKLSENKQRFTGNIPFRIDTILIDPEKQLISANNTAINGVDQELLNTEISLFPNPVINKLNIQNSSEATIEKISIYNMRGKLILQKRNSFVGINLKQLGTGMHLVKIETSQGVLHKTILKQ